MQLVRTEEQVQAMLLRLNNEISEPSIFPNDTYESGVLAGITWALGIAPWDGSEPEFMPPTDPLSGGERRPVPNITGRFAERTVFIGEHQLDPEISLRLRNHSPDGFSWGYGGSGPGQLALALLLYYCRAEDALRHYQQFKFEVVARWPQTDFSLSEQSVLAWLASNGIAAVR